MEAGKLIKLSLGQEPGKFRLNLDGMSITIHLKNQRREQDAKEVAGKEKCLPPAPAVQAAPASAEEEYLNADQLCAELDYYRHVSQEIYEGLGKLSKDINLSIQDLSLAEIIQTASGARHTVRSTGPPPVTCHLDHRVAGDVPVIRQVGFGRW
jgi:hypothetical protein